MCVCMQSFWTGCLKAPEGPASHWKGICVYMQRMLSMSWPRSPKTNPAPPLEGNLSSFAMMSHGAVDQSDARVAGEFCHLLFSSLVQQPE